jgi:hypothetical protein
MREMGMSSKTPTEKIQAALDEDARLREEATPGPWAKPYYDSNPGDRGWWIHNGLVGSEEYAVAVTFSLNPRGEFDAKLLHYARNTDLGSCLRIAVEALVRIHQRCPHASECCGFADADEALAQVAALLPDDPEEK